MSSFGDRLREARTAAGLTQEQLGAACGVTNSAVSAWENGRDVPSFHALPKLREALRQPLDALICGAPLQAGGYVYATAVKDGDYSMATDTNRATTNKEIAVLQRFRGLSKKRQAALLDLLKPGGMG